MANIDTVKKAAQGSQLVTVEDYIKKNEHLITRALNNTISAERFLAVVNIVVQSPALQGCSQASLVSAVLQTVQIGLTPGPVGHIYYVPFYKGQTREVQMIIGYRGLVELINRSKEATILSAFVVYEKDYFEYENGLNPVLKHRPFSGDRGEMIGVYCIAKNNIANEKVFIYIQKEEVEKVKNESLNKIAADKRQYSPWVKWEESMWLKTSVRRIAKLLPLSVEIQQNIEADETIKTSISPKMTDAPDKTDWNSATDAEIKTDDPEPSSPNPVAEEKKDHSLKKESKLCDVAIGSSLLEFKALINSVSSRKTKTGKDISAYAVEDSDGSFYVIEKFGTPKEGAEGALATFFEIKVTEFQGNRKYLAKDVILDQ